MTNKKKTTTNLYTPTTAEELFGVLRRFFKAPDGHPAACAERRKAWDAISGLRGPDSELHESKAATTAIIRRHLLGDVRYLGLTVHPDSPSYAKERHNLTPGEYSIFAPGESSHFVGHANDAFRALGLRWGEVNHGPDDEDSDW